MKRILTLLLSIVMLLSLAAPAYAIDGNIDGGGGHMGDGTSTDYWNPGMDGVRVSVVNAETHSVVTRPIDLTNKQPPSGIIHFGKVCKLSYNGGVSLSPVVGGYSYLNPAQSLPRIVSSGEYPADIDAVRSYFTDEQVIRSLAGHIGMDFDTLVNGTYKIVIEPIAYFHYNSQYFGMTATEAALYNKVVNGGLRQKMTSLTHKNLPLAIFLEEADLGYPAWGGSHSQKVNDDQIISSLGIGIVRFSDITEPPEVSTYDYEYRVDTDVITSVEVSGGQADPDNPITVQFIIGGRTYTVRNVYYPDGDSQLAWVKWHTPSDPCVYTISVRVIGGGSAQGVITANIVDLEGHDPPNPVADDRNDSFRLSPMPVNSEVTNATWGIWSPWWQENWVWVEHWEKCWHTDRWVDDEGKVHRDRWYHWVDNGWWEDQGWWEFDHYSYSASLTGSMKITPDSKSPTSTGSSLKSGYGIQEKVDARVSTTQSAAVTAAQNAVTYFPEFGYEGFWRLLDRNISSRHTRFSFKDNPFSTYNRPTHFTPIWYPDGSYTPYTYLLDCWTPVGMLSMNLSDRVTIRGDLWEEWHKPDLADAMRIPSKDFRWYAAFHNESHHPHIHMMIWSDDSQKGFLTKEGIASMRSKLTNSIFKDELVQLYAKKDIAYKDLSDAAKETMSELIGKMETGIYDSPVIEEKMQELVRQLDSTTGKKQYGYLRKPLKRLVDEIVDELAKQTEVAGCYQVWNELRDKLESYYHEQNPRQHQPLSQQKEFRAIKNMVIQEAEKIRMGEHSFEDENMEDEPEPEEADSTSHTVYEQVVRYRHAKEILCNPELTAEGKKSAILELEKLWSEGYSIAAHQLGKFYRDDYGILQDTTKAEDWFQKSAECGNSFSEYALGKLLESEGRVEDAIHWLEKAATHENQFALYRLGKLFLSGEKIHKDVSKAVEYLTRSATMGNQYAQYALGKLFLLGKEVTQDKTQAKEWLSQAASQGNEYAHFLLDRIDQFREPSVLLSATRLLHHMAKIFRDQSASPKEPGLIHIESKRRKRLLEKRMAMGHKADDHEQHSQIKLTI